MIFRVVFFIQQWVCSHSKIAMRIQISLIDCHHDEQVTLKRMNTALDMNAPNQSIQIFEENFLLPLLIE